jgi:hypothetical protein
MRRKSYFKDLDFNKDWTEEDWEKFFQLQDEYLTQKLNPTLILRLRNPSARPSLTNIDRAFAELGLPSDAPVIKELYRQTDGEASDGLGPLENPLHVSKEGTSLADLPLFGESCAFAQELNRTLDKMKTRKGANLRGEHDALKLHICWSALNIALGHKIGYDRDAIRGNIAKCKRALKHADACVSLMNQLSRRSKSSKLKRDLFSKSIRLRNNISAWIDDLRLKFDTRAQP